MPDAPITIDELRITLNAVFVSRSDAITDDHVKDVIEAAKENIENGSTPILNILRKRIGTSAFVVTAFVYYSMREAYFLPNLNINDKIASYILIIEIDDRRAAIFKKSTGNTTAAIAKNFDLSSYDDLINTFDDSRSLIQKLSARDMNVSDKGMRSRSYEAVDLKGQMSPQSTGRSIPRFTQVKSKNDVVSMSLMSGRINQLTDRATVDQAAAWAQLKFNEMERKRVDNSFFSSFARRVLLSDAIKNARPANILFERSSIERDASDEELQLVYARNGQ